MFKITNQTKLRSFQLTLKHKYGFQVSRDYNHAKRLDEKNANTK